MKHLIIIISLPFFIYSCKSNKQLVKVEETIEIEDKKENQDPFSLLCECKNSKGVSIEEYGQQKSQEENKSVEEYAQSLPELMKTPENWLFNEFLEDDVFIANMEPISTMTPPSNQTPEEEAKIMMEAMKNYPICFQALPYMIAIAKGN